MAQVNACLATNETRPFCLCRKGYSGLNCGSGHGSVSGGVIAVIISIVIIVVLLILALTVVGVLLVLRARAAAQLDVSEDS